VCGKGGENHEYRKGAAKAEGEGSGRRERCEKDTKTSKGGIVTT